MTTLILTEKPSVARSIANVLGTPVKEDGYLKVKDYYITWAVGHLVSLATPESYNSEWKSWSLNSLPMVPDEYNLVINSRTKKQYSIVKNLMGNKNMKLIIFATDAGAEGELIARWIYEKTNCSLPIKRLWISSLTKEAIQNGFNNLQPIENYNNLYKAAAARAQADWLIGLNTTRAVTCLMRQKNAEYGVFSVGRVQTPTLKIIVDREKEIQEFIPEEYYEVIAVFVDNKNTMYAGKYYSREEQSSRIKDHLIAEKIKQEVEGKVSSNVEIEEVEKVLKPPELFSLVTLQQACIQKFGISAKEVDEIVQNLYEKGLISYPRTADNLVTPDVVATFPRILSLLTKQFYNSIPAEPRDLENDSRYVGPVSDHHAIIPTGTTRTLKDLELEIFELIANTFIAAHHCDGIDVHRTTSTFVREHLFIAKDVATKVVGWRKVFSNKLKNYLFDELETPVYVKDIEIEMCATSPPPLYTEASLLKIMKERNLGTPATRAAIIENLKNKQYVILSQKKLTALDKGNELIGHLGESPLVSHDLTARWEESFIEIRDGKKKLVDFEREIEKFIRGFVEEHKKQASKVQNGKAKVTNVLRKCPKCSDGQIIKIEKVNKQGFYGCSRYRYGCRFFVSEKISGQQISDTDMKQLLIHGKTKAKTFNFKTGKTKAFLVLNPDGSITFSFETGILSRVKSLFKNGRR